MSRISWHVGHTGYFSLKTDATFPMKVILKAVSNLALIAVLAGAAFTAGTVDAIAGGDFSTRLTPTTQDEVGQLTR